MVTIPVTLTKNQKYEPSVTAEVLPLVCTPSLNEPKVNIFPPTVFAIDSGIF